MSKNHSKVAVFLSAAIDACAKTQMEIADEVGFPRPNILSMLKTGVTKLPVARVPAMAKALGVDPVELFRIVMEEYMPDILKVTDEIYGRDKLNKGEAELIKRLRVTTGGKSFRIDSAANAAIDELAESLK